jgi:translation initiation factor IF-2
VKKLFAERVPTIEVEKEIGRAMVLKAFSSTAKKQVLGARHVSGTLSVGSRIKLMRKDAEISRGSIVNLQQARADVKEIKTEGDFGTEIETREQATYGDEIVAFVVTEA